MPPPSDHPSLALKLLEQPFYVIQLKIDEAIPSGALAGVTKIVAGFLSITRTDEEVSIVCDVNTAKSCALVGEKLWRCIKIRGAMDFELTGIMCDFTTPLKAAKISIFAVSTWNTDYVLLPAEKADEAVMVFEK